MCPPHSPRHNYFICLFKKTNILFFLFVCFIFNCTKEILLPICLDSKPVLIKCTDTDLKTQYYQSRKIEIDDLILLLGVNIDWSFFISHCIPSPVLIPVLLNSFIPLSLQMREFLTWSHQINGLESTIWDGVIFHVISFSSKHSLSARCCILIQLQQWPILMLHD